MKLDRPVGDILYQISSNFILTQSVGQHLCEKYECQFNFYQGKAINQIVFNRKKEKATLAAKDIAVFVEDIEYLKRYYSHKNNHGKEQIKDRMRLLTNFYTTAQLLTYQYPMMVITHTQDVFMKRHKRLKKTQNQEASSQSKPSQIYQQLGKQYDGNVLDSLDWSDLVNSQFSIQDRQKKKQNQIEFQEEQYCIYGTEMDKKTNTFLQRMAQLSSELSVQLVLDAQENEKTIKHLVLDFDQVDKDEVLRQYKKIANKENTPSKKSYISREQISDSPFKLMKLIDKKPLSSSITISPIEQVNIGDKYNQKNIAKQSMLLGSREQRDQEMKVMKRSTNYEIETKAQKYSFPEDMVITQNQCQESPIHDLLIKPRSFNLNPSPTVSPINPTNIPTKSDFHLFSRNFKKSQQIKNNFGQSLMKQSQIMQGNQFNSNRAKQTPDNKQKIQKLTKLKQKPIQLKQISHSSGDGEQEENFLLKQQQLKKQKLNINWNDPFAPRLFLNSKHESRESKQHQPVNNRLKRVKSHDNLKFSPDKGWYQDPKLPKWK